MRLYELTEEDVERVIDSGEKPRHVAPDPANAVVLRIAAFSAYLGAQQELALMVDRA